MNAEVEPTRNTAVIGSVQRAMKVLGLFGRSDLATLGVSEIARELALPKAVVYRILNTLRLEGFIEGDEAS